MARREYDQIVSELKQAITEGKIWNVDYKDISEDANRGAENEKRNNVSPLEKRGDDWWAYSVADRQMLMDWDIPYSVLHYPGWLKRSQKKLLTVSIQNFPELEARHIHIKRWAIVAELLKEAKPLIVKGRKPNTGIIEPRSNTVCQICARQIELFGKTIAHHGYERPGTGWQTASCEGARELSFNLSRDVLGQHIKNVELRIRTIANLLQSYIDRMVTRVPGPTIRRQKGDPLYNPLDSNTWTDRPLIDSSHTKFEYFYQIAQASVETELRQLKAYKEYQVTRYNNWKPQPEILV